MWIYSWLFAALIQGCSVDGFFWHVPWAAISHWRLSYIWMLHQYPQQVYCNLWQCNHGIWRDTRYYWSSQFSFHRDDTKPFSTCWVTLNFKAFWFKCTSNSTATQYAGCQKKKYLIMKLAWTTGNMHFLLYFCIHKNSWSSKVDWGPQLMELLVLLLSLCMHINTKRWKSENMSKQSSLIFGCKPMWTVNDSNYICSDQINWFKNHGQCFFRLCRQQDWQV